MSARRGLTYLLGGNAGAFAIQFAGSVAIARLLSPPEMGVYAASMAIVWIINGVLNVGIPSYLVREREMPPEKLGTVFTLTAAQSAIVAAGLLLGAPLVGELAHDVRVTQSVRILAWFGALMPVLTMLLGLMQRRGKFDRVVAISLINVAVSIGCTIGFAANGYSWASMPLGTGIGVTVAVMLGIVLQREDCGRTPFSRTYLGPMLTYGSRMMSASLIMNFTNRLPDVMLTRISGAGATGLYNRGANLIDTFNNSLMSSFQRVLASQMAQDRDTEQGIGPSYARMSRVVTGLFWPAFALLTVLAAPIITFLFGARWLAAAPVLAISAMAAAINMTVAGRTDVLVTAGREKQLPRIEAIRGLIGVVLFTIAAYWGGLIWAALTRIVDAAVAVALYSPGIHAATKLSWSSMARAFARSAIIAAVTAVPAVGMMAWLHWPSNLPPFELIGLLALCGVVWVASLFVTRHELAAEAARAFGMIRARLPGFA